MKVTIIGAGMVGSSIAYATMIKGIAREIALVDINKELAKGQAMDLSHGNAYVRPIRIHGGDYDVSSDSDVVVITAGRPQKGGESRLQLLTDNARIVKEAVTKSLSFSKEPVFHNRVESRRRSYMGSMESVRFAKKQNNRLGNNF